MADGPFRDDGDAARARADALAGELERAKAENERLETEIDRLRHPPPPPPPEPPAPAIAPPHAPPPREGFGDTIRGYLRNWDRKGADTVGEAVFWMAVMLIGLGAVLGVVILFRRC